MINSSEWNFIPSYVEANIFGRRIKQKSNVSNSGLLFKNNGNSDLEIQIIGCIREFKFTLKKEVCSISWKFYICGKLTIVTKSKIYIYLSNARSDLIILFVKWVSNLLPSCLNPSIKFDDTILKSETNFEPKISLDFLKENKLIQKQNKFRKLDLLESKKFTNTYSNIIDCEMSNSLLSTLNFSHFKSKDYFSNLPEDLLFYIFSMIGQPFLSIYNSQESRSENLFFKDELVKLTDIAFVNHRLLHFTLSNMWKISIKSNKDNKYSILNKNIQNLGIISFLNNNMKDIEIKNLAISKNLSTCVLEISIINQNNIKESTLKLLLLKFENLKSLEILDCRKISGYILFQVMKKNLSLKYIKIGNRNKPNHMIKDESLMAFSHIHTEKENLVQKCQNVKFPKLTYFELLNCVEITKLSFLTDYAQNLEYLDLRGCINISDSEFRYLFELLKNLKVLLLSKNLVNDEKMNLIFKNCKALEVLDISNCPNISNEMMEKIPSNLKRLTGIKLSFCENLEISSFLKILSECREIELIDLTGCFKIEATLFNNKLERNISPSIKKIGIHRLSLDTRKFRLWITQQILDFNCTKEFSIVDQQEIYISEFTEKYQILKRKEIESNRQIWRN